MFKEECVYEDNGVQCSILLSDLVEDEFKEDELELKGSLAHKLTCGHYMHEKCFKSGIEKGRIQCPKCKKWEILVDVKVIDGRTDSQGFSIKLQYGENESQWKPLRQCEPVELAAFVAYMDKFKGKSIEFYKKGEKEAKESERKTVKQAKKVN